VRVGLVWFLSAADRTVGAKTAAVASVQSPLP
jgi:hypothetical protein